MTVERAQLIYCVLCVCPAAGDVDEATVSKLLSTGEAEQVAAGADTSLLGDAPAKPAVPAALTEEVSWIV